MKEKCDLTDQIATDRMPEIPGHSQACVRHGGTCIIYQELACQFGTQYKSVFTMFSR